MLKSPEDEEEDEKRFTTVVTFFVSTTFTLTELPCADTPTNNRRSKPVEIKFLMAISIYFNYLV